MAQCTVMGRRTGFSHLPVPVDSPVPAVRGGTGATGRRRRLGRMAGRVVAFGLVVCVVVLFRDRLPVPAEVWAYWRCGARTVAL
jgi:hypothetical protein